VINTNRITLSVVWIVIFLIIIAWNELIPSTNFENGDVAWKEMILIGMFMVPYSYMLTRSDAFK
jgi:hypothetical protein